MMRTSRIEVRENARDRAWLAEAAPAQIRAAARTLRAGWAR